MASTATDAAVEQKTRPTKPDEATYKANLAIAEKEHAAAQEKLVRSLDILCTSFRRVLILQSIEPNQGQDRERKAQQPGLACCQETKGTPC